MVAITALEYKNLKMRVMDVNNIKYISIKRHVTHELSSRKTHKTAHVATYIRLENAPNYIT